MTREEALAVLKTNYRCMTEEKNCPRTCEGCGLAMQPGELEEAIRVADAKRWLESRGYTTEA